MSPRLSGGARAWRGRYPRARWGASTFAVGGRGVRPVIWHGRLRCPFPRSCHRRAPPTFRAFIRPRPTGAGTWLDTGRRRCCNLRTRELVGLGGVNAVIATDRSGGNLGRSRFIWKCFPGFLVLPDARELDGELARDRHPGLLLRTVTLFGNVLQSPGPQRAVLAERAENVGSALS